ncbi:ATP-dependent helicase [Candidatus Uhrbacteria bacterium CG10_big_fil_rev_8_21_14_0_10_48_11]|uniref:ATP-dependent helicase n=1 Tax=Candidatus Uhrbacteria bacterium CG10_big_fil_rev_8_21_14_0_10_48_11 TaxID=1975037 RepID=A0A2M8LFK0_9BACT|nr:MAG: ATP-dependent helicase [Candidatus Uhrbacteria bacterium CG10_big_fil_rev_8_21_14_0_10_48_11]
MPQNEPTDSNSFFGLGIAPKLLEALDTASFKVPTPIQRQSIPIAIEGKDLIGIAQTGTGKTLAFGVPLIQRLAQVKGRGLIMLPTRELALQVEETLQKIGRPIGLRTAVLIGGAPYSGQQKSLAKKPHIIVATPGRLLDHLEQKTLKLDDVRVLVLDEADRMLDMGFMPQIKRVLESVPKDKQIMLFSATMPDQIVRLIKSHLHLPVRIEIARPGTAATQVSHELFVVRREDKLRLLEKMLNQYRGTVLVFARTKHSVKRITSDVRAMGAKVAEIHSNRSLAQRREALEGFKRGKYRVLIATDIAARGIDVTNIELVVNFDLPENPEDYVHRIGRTGRAGLRGHAISFATPDQGSNIRDIERLIRVMLPISKLPELPPARRSTVEREYTPQSRRSGFGGARSSGASRGRNSFNKKKGGRRRF